MQINNSACEIPNVTATCFSDSSTGIFVSAENSGNRPCFKYCNTGGYRPDSAVAGISLVSPEYIHSCMYGHPELLLTPKAMQELNDRLLLPSLKYSGVTVFQAIIIDWNIENYGVFPEETKSIQLYESGKPLPLTLEQPDYRLLPAISEASKQIVGKKIAII